MMADHEPIAAAEESAAAAAPIRIGTRGSQLAVTQTTWAAEQIAAAAGRPFEIVKVTTHGDVNRASLSMLGGQGVFATELREALLAGECELVVHSLKDLPTAKAPGLELAAFPAREDRRDALCSAGGAKGLRLMELPQGAKVGTGSPRRVAELKAIRPDLDIRDLRGNVDSRLARVTSGELDAVILACAGLERLGRIDAITERLDLDRFPTAPGQGCLGIETRDGEGAIVASIDDRSARLEVLCERAVLRTLDAGCSAPLGVNCRVTGSMIECSASVFSLDGTQRIDARGMRELSEDERAFVEAEVLGNELARELLSEGAGTLL